MKSANKHLLEAKKKSNVTGYDVQSLKLTFKYFSGRILATAGGWFCNDVFFYGNKLFQSEFISVIRPDSKNNIIPNWEYNLLNVSISLVGYYMACFMIDNKLYGRKTMQQIGFLMCFIFFVIPAFKYTYFSTQNLSGFQALYFLSSFFNQFGPNSVTFLVAAEVYPTPVRATAHGFSAAVGKLGALMTALLGTYEPVTTRFYIVPWFGLGGMILTAIFLPDTTGLDLKEQERRWQYLRVGREAEYHGVAVHPKHLSWWERWWGVGKYYDPDLDYRRKIEEMRKEWEMQQARLAEEKGALEEEGDVHEEAVWSSEVNNYFSKGSPNIQANEKEVDVEETNGAENGK
jgi:hypothetical protein